MFIEKLSIESFGSLSSVSYDLKPGINIFHGKNECGKSTLAAFIKFVFYGLCGKIPDQSMSEKSRYTNWDHGISGGNLIINDGGKRYRIERRLTPAAKASGKETVKIIDLESGAEVYNGKCPGEVFFGVSEEIFSQTAFSAQGSGSVVDAEKMNNAIDNILFSGNEAVSVKSALKKLDEARVFLLHKNQKGGKIYNIDRTLEELEERIAKAEENESFLDAKNRSLNESRRQNEENKQLLRETEDKLTHYEAATVLSRFADLDGKKTAFQSALSHAGAMRTKHTHKGFMPGYDYLDSLKKLESDLAIAENERRSFAQQKEAFALTSLSPAQQKIFKAVEEAGGKEKAEKSLRAAGNKRKSKIRNTVFFTLLSVITAVLSVAAGVMGIFSESPAILYGIYGVTALFLLITLVLATSLASRKHIEYYQKFSASTLEDALSNLESAILAEKAVREEDERYNDLCQRLSNSEKKKDALVTTAKTLLGKWELPYTDLTSLAVGIQAVTDGIDELEAAALRLRDAKLSFESAESALKGFSRQEYEEILRKTAYVGEVKAEEVDDLKRKKMFYSKKGIAIEERIRTLELEIASRTAVTENSDELKEVLAEEETRREEYVDKYKAYVLAYEAIRQSGERLRARIAPTLSESASKLMQESTLGKYADIGVDNTMTLSFRTSDAAPSRQVGFMSAGTKALTYISLRLSLIRMLFKETTPPTVFDEAFSWLDKDRMTAMMSILKTYASDTQVIVMTCCDREYEACTDKSAVNLIEIRS